MAICDMCNATVQEGGAYLVHGRLIARSDWMPELTKVLADIAHMPTPVMQAKLMERARRDTTPWLVCETCVPHFLSTEEERASARALADRYISGDDVPLEACAQTSSLFESAPARTEPQTASAVARGWYKDPSRRHQYRFWSGSRWTEDVVDAGKPAKDPAVRQTVSV